MGREWAGPRIGTPPTGLRTEERFRRWRSPSISSCLPNSLKAPWYTVTLDPASSAVIDFVFTKYADIACVGCTSSSGPSAAETAADRASQDEAFTILRARTTSEVDEKDPEGFVNSPRSPRPRSRRPDWHPRLWSER